MATTIVQPLCTLSGPRASTGCAQESSAQVGTLSAREGRARADRREDAISCAKLSQPAQKTLFTSDTSSGDRPEPFTPRMPAIGTENIHIVIAISKETP